jgi:hypothetical protein
LYGWGSNAYSQLLPLSYTEDKLLVEGILAQPSPIPVCAPKVDYLYGRDFRHEASIVQQVFAGDRSTTVHVENIGFVPSKDKQTQGVQVQQPLTTLTPTSSLEYPEKQRVADIQVERGGGWQGPSLPSSQQLHPSHPIVRERRRRVPKRNHTRTRGAYSVLWP